jgi:primase-polymerase (primpol)-like protein
MNQYPQFILWRLSVRDGKQVKVPIDYRTANIGNAHDSGVWMPLDTAVDMATAYGADYGVGFVFTPNDPFVFIDLDKCLLADGQTWSPVATDMLSRFPGAYIEVSQSGRGLHVICSASQIPEHGCKNIPLGLEMYHEGRFVALTGYSASGSALQDCTLALPATVGTYFPPRVGEGAPIEWSTEAVAEWNGPAEDEVLIAKMLASKSAASVFTTKATFAQLWQGDESALSIVYPDPEGSRPYDGSSADAALAQHLAFWTGKNCERIQRIMQMSGLVRDKWSERDDYLPRTILRAVALQGDVYQAPRSANTELISQFAPCVLKGSPEQIAYAENIRVEKILQAPTHEMAVQLAQIASASYWIDHRLKLPEEMVAMVTPAPLMEDVTSITLKSGYQYLAVDQQVEKFKGCVYVVPLHKVFHPTRGFLKPETFNSVFGGYVWQLDDTDKSKVTKKAFEAFTESQLVSYPMADGTWFRPDQPAGQLFMQDGKAYINTYIPVPTKRMVGDAQPFLTHVEKILPVERDRRILLSYMAACVQHIGVKFQWALLIQGTEGNGKSLFTRCVNFAIGDFYTHLPQANELAEKFNDWLFGKLFIGIEDIYVPDHKKEVLEVLKPMITNNRLAKRAMQQGQVTDDVYANFILNTNHKDAIRKTENDRRFCVFYTAQQTRQDVLQAGMDGKYFTELYQWLRNDGYAIVNEFLHTYPIDPEFNPAGLCQVAPTTSSTAEAVGESRGSIENVVLEAIHEGFVGMMGGWISSIALDKVLKLNRYEKLIPINKRKALLESLGFIAHPALHDGRVNNPIAIDEGKKPRLFVLQGHAALGITNPTEVARAYQEAQGLVLASRAFC